ncbi:hypothetical protein ACJJTC_007986 [Scirpophaga incertulas]
MVNIQGLSRTGQHKVTHGVVTPQIIPLSEKKVGPGPGAHMPQTIHIRYKRPPAFTMRPAAKPQYEPWDQWTPSPNMYCPPILGKKAPAFTFRCHFKESEPQLLPGPGAHNPNYTLVKKKKPSFSFGAPYRTVKYPKTPPPNAYCERKFMVSKRSIPAPSFGIRHTQYLGQQAEYMRPSTLDIY